MQPALSCSQALNGGPATHDHRQKATDIPTAMALFGYPVAQENEAERV
jgi:hypothetical protein